MVQLVARCIETPVLAERRFMIINAISANTRRWMDDTDWAAIGYAPVDDAERFASEVEHLHGLDDDVTEKVQGGFFAAPDYRGLGRQGSATEHADRSNGPSGAQEVRNP